MTLGDRLKEARKKIGYTQMDIAKKLGITNGALSGYERNYRDPDTEMLKRIANLYGVSTDYLLKGDPDLEQPELFGEGEIEEADQITIFIQRLHELIINNKIDEVDLKDGLKLSNAEFREKYNPFHYSKENIKKKDIDAVLSIIGEYEDFLLGKTDSTDKNKTYKDEKDIAKRLKQFEADLENSNGLAFDGEPMSDEAKESLLESMELLFRQTQRINKKFTPKKYREDE